MSTPRSLSQWILAILVGAAALSVVQGMYNAIVPETGSKDFQWSVSRLLLKRQDPYAAYLANDSARSEFLLSQAPTYPVAGLVLLWPYAAVDWPIAKTLWAVSNLAFTAVLLLALFRLLPPGTTRHTRLWIAALLLLSTPWRTAIGNGQHAVFSLAAFLIAFVVYVEGKRGGVPALAVSWFKYTVTFPLTVSLTASRRGWILIAGAATLHAAIMIAAALWIGTSPLTLLAGQIKVTQTIAGAGYLDVFGIANRLGTTSKSLPTIVAVAILGMSFWAARKDSNPLSCLSTLSLVAITIVYHQSYDLVVLVLPLAYAVSECARSLRSWLYLCLIAVFWFMDKGMTVASEHGLLAASLDQAYYGCKVLLLYGTLGFDWFVVLRSSTNSPDTASESPVPAPQTR